jgi:dCMP deaminase
MRSSRPSWDEYFMGIALLVAKRSTCDRAHVGAVLIREKQILSTGYNGSPAKAPHCDDIGHQMESGHCVRTIHAEMNAIVQAAKNGVNISRSDLYVTHFPCYICFKQLANSGVRSITFLDAYRMDQKVVELAEHTGILLRHLQKEMEIPRIRIIKRKRKKRKRNFFSWLFS